MSTCHWCLSVNGGVAELLQEYCAGSLSAEVEKEVSEDLKFCSDCVEAYHREKENVPGLHGRLWKLETSRLLRAFSDAEKGALSDNDLICVDEDGCEAGVPDLNPAQYAYDLTVPMFEVLKYPYLLAHPELSEMCVRAICKMAEYDSFVVTDKYAGIYLLLVHPNETVRRWAIEAAKSLGKVDRDDFYDFQDIFSCMFYIVELGIPQNLADMDMPYNPMTKMTWLPPHLYDSSNAKNYWLGICMLLTQLDAQAMDSLFLGPDKQANILNCILNTIEKDTDDEEMDPFWPVLRCFMVILDCLGSRIWGQIEPSQAFQAITGSPSYIAAIERIKEQTRIPQIKTESVNDDDMVTCSQMVYNSSTNVSQDKQSKSSRTTDSSVMYEEMNSLVNLMNSDMGLPFSVKDSTFLWFIPFVKSVMDLDDRSVIYIGEVVHFLCGGISTDPLNRNVCISDKVAEFFALILIHIIELHKESDRMNMLYYCAPKWVGVLVKCATLPVEAFVHTSEGSASHSVSSTSSRVRAPRKVSTSRTVPQACIKIIRSLLKEGSRINPNSKCNEFLNLVNKQLREGPQKEWKLNRSEIQDLQSCLKNYVKMIVNRPTTNAPPPEPLKIVGPKPTTTPPLQSSDEDSGSSGIAELKHTLKHEAPWDCNEGLTSDLRDSNGVWTGRDLKEEKETEGFVELNNDSRPTRAIVSSLKTSQCKIQEIKSRLGSLMTKKSNSERDGPGTTFAQDKPQSVLSSGRDEVEMPADPSCAQEESFDNEELDDLPLSILRTTFIRNKVSKSGKRHTEHIDQSPPQSPSGIIVISDEDDDAVQTGLCFSDTSKIKHEHEPIDASGQNHSPLRDYDGDMSESQVFEFETLEDMASAWSDQGSGSKIISERTQKDSPVRPTVLTVSTTSGVLDTQPVSDDDIERACQQVEELEKLKTPTQECKRGIVKKRDLLVDAKPLRSKCLSEKSKLVKKQAKEGLPALRKSNSKLCLNRLETKMPSSLTTSLTSAISHKTSIPAIVPPKKVRKAIVPASTAERLGLKKKERKAFDLSQRTLDSLDELRRYGASVNVPQTKKSTRQTKRSKVTSPQKRVVSVSNKKLLASQECQFFRQSKQASGGRTSANVPKKRDPINSEENLRPSFVTAEEDEDEDLPCSQPDPVSPVETLNATCSLQKKDPQADSTPASSVSSSMNSFVSPYFQSNYEVTPGPSDQDTRKEEKGAGDDDEDSDWMHLTQMEPTDMEICSQMEGENFFHPQPDPVDLDSDKQVPFQEIAGLSDWTRPVQATDNGPETPLVPQSFKKPTTSPPSVTRLDQEDDRLFLKPGMSPISLKKAKPSTTKIYATSKSRNASLAQEMENTAKAKCLSASTPAGRGRPARSVGCAQNVPEPSQTIFRKPFPPKERLYRPIASQKPPPKPIPPPQQPPPRPPQNVPHPPGQPILPIQHCNIGSTPQPSTSKTCPRPDALVHRQIPNQDVGFRYDPNYLIQGILSWTFDMFSNYKQFGLPSEICELPLETVGLNFNSYDEYYNTFYPVLLTNAFEELAGEWLENKESGKVVSHDLKVVANDKCNNFWNVSFTASITSIEECCQLYPKEEDLVILWLPQNRSSYLWPGHSIFDHQEHFGYVQRSSVFNQTAGQSPTLNLTIRILGNVSLVNQQMVRCDVVGSLVSTMREFKAICRLRNCSMRRPLLSPQAPFFQSGPEVIPSLPGYNSDQVRAVKTAMSIIRNRLNNPKICLIHGPPGTGKSKTIVGLLQNLFHEGVNMQAKSRQMRVLVCAPSNAAIDSLMKKIIVVFKEKCKNVQGNCGYINLVRLGNDRTISESMKPFSLDNQVKSRIEKYQAGHHKDVHRHGLQLDEEIDRISNLLPKLKKKDREFEEMAAQKSKLLKERQALSSELRKTRSAKQVTQTQVLIDAHVICCTLSTSGSSLLESAFRRLGHEPFGCVIVDEAGQATETETLIPMLYRCNALVLVGDPNQLPPTVISQRAKELNYGQSLMARLVTVLDNSSKDNNIPSPVIFLSNQYRMHPDICRFPSKHVYHNALKTDNETAERRVNLSWPFQPYQVFDVTDGQEVKERDSFSNPKEIQLVRFLLDLIAVKQQVRVGVITPYKAQKDRINREVAKLNLVPLGPRVEVDTVDGFQGREMDCIIVSCVRASHEQGNIGFLGNRQRLNVTITRAKCSLFILGHLRTLRENNEWGALIKDAATRDVIIQTNEMTFKADAMKIFKQDRPRSLSHLPREPVPPRPAAASCRAAPPSMRRSTHPAPVFHARDSAPQRRPSSLSPPQATETRDPRLMVQHPQAPQHRPEWDSRAEVRRDPRLERLRDPQFERDPRGRSSPEQYPQAGYQDNRRWADRERRHSPASTSYPRDRVGRPLRDPRQTDSYRYGATASSNHHTHTQKRPTDQQWIPPTDAKRAKR
ncbi:probable helicase senataxin [Esox lucius]|uniref:probable helicase senataxin n=1 Tax=Esox lucius TaxID=8010 RepID=UPI001477842E|nr:probable helicase senataxin [Esox lucius]